MDAEFQKFVDAAADVHTSGRWNAVSKRIEALAANPGKGNEWRVQLLGSLCAEVLSQYLQVKRAFEDTRYEAPLLAYFARNLLELSVWVLYCEKGEANARRLYEDARRDQVGIYDAFEKWGKATGEPAEFLNIFSTAKQDLVRRAAAEGIASLDTNYKKVHDAAVECGLGDGFALDFRLLSKFAHPTALRIIGTRSGSTDTRQRDWFFSWGCLYFRGTFDSLEKQLMAL